MSYPPLIDLRIGFWPVVHFIRPCSLFPIDNLSIYAQNFFKFCIHIVIGDEWYGIVNGQNLTIFDGVTALSPFKKWFLACFSSTVYDIWMKLHRYVEQQRLHITTKDRHSYLSSSWVICPWLILSISVLLLFRHYISHKITFGAPSSGGVLCSACGAFISSPEPLAHGELLWSLDVHRVSSIVNNCFKGHLLLNYWLDFDQTW